MKSCRNRNTRKSRSGQAPLELVLLMPMLVAMFLTVLTVGSVGLTHSTVAIESYQSVWAERHALNHGQINVNGVDQIALVLKPNSYSEADAGLLEGDAETELNSFLPRLLDNLAPARHEASAFSGSWDYRVIDFDSEDNHDPLELGKRVMGFRGNSSMRSAFKMLAGMSGSSGRGVEAANKAFPQVPMSSSTNSNGIAQLSRQLANKLAELAREYARRRPSFSTISRLRREIEKLRKQIALIKQSNQLLKNARR